MIFVAAARGHFYIAWHWWLAGITLSSLTELYPMEKVYFNSYYLEGTARDIRLKTSLFSRRRFN